MGVVARPVKDRLLVKVNRDPKTGCWLWLGALNNRERNKQKH